MNEPIERFLRANGMRHHTLTWNNDAPITVVLCHGFLDHAWSFDALGRVLAEAGLRAVAFSWRGHGETDRVGAGGYYHFPDYVLDLHALMPLLADGETHLVGHSMGGTAAALYASTHSAVLQTLTLIEGLGPPHFSKEAPEKMSAWLDSVDRLRRKPPRPMADVSEAVARMRVQHAELPQELASFLAEKGTVEASEGRVWRFDPLHRTTSPTAFDAEVFRSFLRRIEAPTLLVQGSRGFVTADHAARVAALPHACELMIDDVGHMIHWMRPRELGRAIVQHVLGNRGAAR